MSQERLSQLEKLKLQQEKIKARIQKMEARESEKSRKQDTRRKILLGAYMLEEAEKTGTLGNIKQKLNDFLKRDSDRALFDLPPLSSS